MKYQLPLMATHRALNAKMVDFAGWEMPLHYKSPKIEHLSVRNHAGVFDISHMARFSIEGSGAASYLMGLLTCDCENMDPLTGRYGLIPSDEGGILDDVFVYRLTQTAFILVANAGNRHRVWSHISRATESVKVTDLTETLGMVALQGPKALELWNDRYHDFNDYGSLACPEERNSLTVSGPIRKMVFLSRTGYTGEDGLEIIGDPEFLNQLWETLMSAGVTPCGLAARDSLRFEAGFPLYGHELTEAITPREAGLLWAVRKRDLDRLPFGEKLRTTIPRFRLVWFVMTEPSVARQGYRVFSTQGQVLGTVVSGMYAPTLEGFYGNLYIPRELEQNYLPGAEICVEIHGSMRAARVTKAPLYTPVYRRKKE
ncbi:glycine cleavage system aminomethyltransferase GcvT [Spirochaeta lutea]|uniref:glycine cleavage system aminomethyltransferase GcvT n=1 Tax=Spirochaeta lutea TaxID=1480694 RepID=UPI0006909009|nr:glycine cleavage system aminomethyltransferase GcvT [Spirochaeta lutea]